MIFPLRVFQTVGKFSDERILDDEGNREYTLKNLESATESDISTLKMFEHSFFACNTRHAFTNYEELEKY